MTTLYNVHPQTKEYLPDRDTEAQQNPMWHSETHSPDDRWLYNPKTSSRQPPPETDANEVAVLESGAWVVKPDYRGGVYFDTTTQARYDINEIGIKPDPNWTDKVPLPNSKWNETHWKIDLDLWMDNVVRPQRDARLAACDYKMMPDFPIPSEKKSDWKAYRQALRDLPGQLTQVTDPIPWPSEPGQ